MHGMRTIKVAIVNPANESNPVEMVKYVAVTHPAKGETLIIPGYPTCIVSEVEHVLKADNNGPQRYISLDYVLITVYPA